ncbi:MULTISPECIES: sigma 54-interacting transcriptional regulator [unclassified Cupriavidus]|uniref:sigma-54 interaction domain-containing protein n=1 Tax=unclassified Cupriavidus TaxID=2640874 RepID=UPI001C005406|nr:MULTISPECIES: sigma 54-interacting transcriptional regulator [unclassified Cupriavidus]MCA3187367.1 sigma 54-interacting transcriptional regulator [Cupriavidus sp.]MCA3190900.1 sigma 54-interacting transcriptional regulator [Cupriavidus sp.]MCA3196507.1 sigma 54-interacting transcriptional regulator [Cupriavidus sp.]MCA3205397.1 sigma 54-interacting transcriptional regulator [Cupriavidus sp.]MCA3206231.1 sigma 54-interacting transcriptional regulator [Cupriavidus sp.]
MSTETTQATADPRPDAACLGALLCTADGATETAFGVCTNATVATATLTAWMQAGPAGGRKLFPVAVGEARYIGLSLEDGTRRLILLHAADAQATLFDFLGTVPFADAILDHFLNDPYQAITVVDQAGLVRFISPVHEKFLGLEAGAGIGRAAADVIPNSRLPQVVGSGKAEIGQLQQLNHTSRVVNRIPIRQHGQVVGAIGQVMFKGPEELVRMHKELVTLRSEVARYQREFEGLREGLRERQSNLGLIGESAPMQRLRREIQTVARLDVPVLILGESGTGKELVARAIHGSGHDGPATDRPLVSLNLAALPATLIESELFGHAPGAFTGSKRQGQAGKLELAAGGTVFLDEVADIPMEMQVKLLRVLEDHMVERLGSGRARKVDFRLVSATNRDIPELIDAGRFRLDLYYRLSGVVLRIPALRQRREDIPALLQHFVEAFCTRNGMPAPRIEHDVARYLAGQPWPGNVRQLRQRVEEALVFCDGRALKVADFARGDAARGVIAAQDVDDEFAPEPAFSGETRASTAAFGSSLAPPAPADAPGGMNELAYAAVLDAIARHGGNKKRAAAQLRISRSHLYKILERGGR